MLTKKEAPWLEYLIIDEKTRERKLKNGTPETIRKAYEEYMASLKKQMQCGKKIPKKL